MMHYSVLFSVSSSVSVSCLWQFRCFMGAHCSQQLLRSLIAYDVLLQASSIHSSCQECFHDEIRFPCCILQERTARGMAWSS